jgi:hypothetical protein
MKKVTGLPKGYKCQNLLGQLIVGDGPAKGGRPCDITPAKEASAPAAAAPPPTPRDPCNLQEAPQTEPDAQQQQVRGKEIGLLILDVNATMHRMYSLFPSFLYSVTTGHKPLGQQDHGCIDAFTVHA